jgi:hypothetical protein
MKNWKTPHTVYILRPRVFIDEKSGNPHVQCTLLDLPYRRFRMFLFFGLSMYTVQGVSYFSSVNILGLSMYTLRPCSLMINGKPSIQCTYLDRASSLMKNWKTPHTVYILRPRVFIDEKSGNPHVQCTLLDLPYRRFRI